MNNFLLAVRYVVIRTPKVCATIAALAFMAFVFVINTAIMGIAFDVQAGAPLLLFLKQAAIFLIGFMFCNLALALAACALAATMNWRVE
jgi:hypothetical protein